VGIVSVDPWGPKVRAALFAAAFGFQGTIDPTGDITA